MQLRAVAVVTGEQLDWTIGTFSISADGNQSIIAGPEQELETDTGSITVQADADVSVTGEDLTTNLGDETVQANANVSVTGEELTTDTGAVSIDCRSFSSTKW
jgi:hypothetical protein